MSRLHRTRKDSILALQQALVYAWEKVHNENIDFNRLKLSDISRKFRISTLPTSLVKPYVVCERQPTFASATKLRELLSFNARGKGGTRPIRHEAKQAQPTLFNFNNYDAVEDINRLQDVLSANGFAGHNLEVTLRDGSYTLKLEITKQTN